LNSSFAVIVILGMTNLITAAIGEMIVNIGPIHIDVSPYISASVGVLFAFMWNWTMTSLVIWPKDRLGAVAIAADDQDLRPA
jgi:hypothetical protein